MSIFNYILKSFRYYRKQHLAIIAGTMISTAVLTGALIVGDSVQLSLQNLVNIRLGETEYALVTGDRFVRNQLAQDIANGIDVDAASLLMLQGVSINPANGSRINKTQIIGIENDFWSLNELDSIPLGRDETLINSEVADALNLNVGDEFLVRVEKASIIPLNAPFATEETPSVSFRLKVKDILDADRMGRFSLQNNQTETYNIYMSHDYLANKLDLEGFVNVVLVSDQTGSLTESKLNSSLAEHWKLRDANIVIRDLDELHQFEILSDRIFIDKPIGDSFVMPDVERQTALTYLVNTLRKESKETPYSFVSALTYSINNHTLEGDEIIINQWLADDLDATIADTIALDYFVIGPLRTLEERSSLFIIKDIIPTQGTLTNNSLMPLFPGLADAGSCSEWETGIPIDLDRIRDKDEVYWDDHKGTPKAYIAMSTGKELWQNRYGDYTSIRFDKEDKTREEIADYLLEKIEPQELGLVFTSVRDDGRNAASNGVDFGELFLSMSFFVIVAGVLLTVLLYVLNTESRSQETGVLAGLGLNKKQISKIRFYENLFSVVIGGLAGMFLGILYNFGLMAGINSVWQDIVRTNMLDIYILPTTLFIGTFSGIVIALIAIYWVTTRKLKRPAHQIIKGISDSSVLVVNKRLVWYRIILIFSVSLTILIVGYSLITSVDQNASLFLSAGAMFLVSCLAFFYLYLNRQIITSDVHLPSPFQFAIKNAARQKGRSMAIVALLALGTFSVIITGANRKTFYGSENSRQSGTGGFAYWAETSLPIMYNLNDAYGKSKMGLEDEPILDNVQFIQTHQLEGDDASCLNLNQIQKPRILGIDFEQLDQRDAFSFTTWHKGVDQVDTWKELGKKYGPNVFPAIADQTVIQWGLIKTVGDTLTYLNEAGEEIHFVLAAGLNASIFQGNLLISDEVFQEHFPSAAGSKTMLIETSIDEQEQVSEILTMYLADFGIDITKASERLANFYSVTNTYLTVFMILGGLGVIIGTFGLGVVLIRNILERRSEIALLLATGYKKKRIVKLIFIENIFLLVVGLFIGVLGAAIGILPSLLSPSFNIPETFLIVILGLILASGLIWIYFPSQRAVRKNIIEALRNE